MSRVTLAALLATFIATTATAMSAEIDTDGDGMASLAELQAMYPEVTEDFFIEMDADEDGLINDEELLVAIGAEFLPASAGDL